MTSDVCVCRKCFNVLKKKCPVCKHLSVFILRVCFWARKRELLFVF